MVDRDDVSDWRSSESSNHRGLKVNNSIVRLEFQLEKTGVSIDSFSCQRKRGGSSSSP